MKITDEEKEAAYELQWMVQQILFERERAQLYREIYSYGHRLGIGHEMADVQARQAIANMEAAFEPMCNASKEEADAARQVKAN